VVGDLKCEVLDSLLADLDGRRHQLADRSQAVQSNISVAQLRYGGRVVIILLPDALAQRKMSPRYVSHLADD